MLLRPNGSLLGHNNIIRFRLYSALGVSMEERVPKQSIDLPLLLSRSSDPSFL
jgi:hypothetical protein